MSSIGPWRWTLVWLLGVAAAGCSCGLRAVIVDCGGLTLLGGRYQELDSSEATLFASLKTW